MSDVGLIVLAAGASTRMGTPKQLLRYNQQSLIRHIVEVAIASVCQPVIVVLGAYAELIQPEIDPIQVHIVKNPLWNEGMSTSIRVGMEALNTINPDAEAVVIMLCDQPFVSPQFINQLVEVHQTSGKLIVASEYAYTLGVPALFNRALFAKLTTLSGTAGAKQLIKNYAQEVLAIPFPEGLIDLDTPKDYEQLLAENRQPTTVQI
ncbi:nucleotidyltransferase family protein [Fortiea sp. LEGE XX443]|uniref:nucleotidyltransferase family protein n=1 Tax=Fortiea sp. LEGE XX443 TaxID=1828611 RepID=UPI0018802891|nr:nucleotidyltransferase family protein [Fortiea sp. LEGE XX443]MBE9004000.1 nucleotidyltransferase family protein [Fortiea sp. LEGE XX443]